MSDNKLTENDLTKYHEYIGQLIREARLIKGDKITTVANEINMTHSVISQIENGKYHSLKLDTVLTLFNYLDISLEKLPPHTINHKNNYSFCYL